MCYYTPMGYFTELVERARIEKKINKTAVAAAIGIKRPYYFDMLKGKQPPRSIAKTDYSHLSELLGIPLLDIEIACVRDRHLVEIEISTVGQELILDLLKLAREINQRAYDSTPIHKTLPNVASRPSGSI